MKKNHFFRIVLPLLTDGFFFIPFKNKKKLFKTQHGIDPAVTEHIGEIISQERYSELDHFANLKNVFTNYQIKYLNFQLISELLNKENINSDHQVRIKNFKSNLSTFLNLFNNNEEFRNIFFENMYVWQKQLMKSQFGDYSFRFRFPDEKNSGYENLMSSEINNFSAIMNISENKKNVSIEDNCLAIQSLNFINHYINYLETNKEESDILKVPVDFFLMNILHFKRKNFSKETIALMEKSSLSYLDTHKGLSAIDNSTKLTTKTFFQGLQSHESSNRQNEIISKMKEQQSIGISDILVLSTTMKLPKELHDKIEEIYNSFPSFDINHVEQKNFIENINNTLVEFINNYQQLKEISGMDITLSSLDFLNNIQNKLNTFLNSYEMIKINNLKKNSSYHHHKI
jgi:hypothetical protein